MGVKVTIETVTAYGGPSDGSGEGTTQETTYFTPTAGAIVNVIAGDGGGADVRHAASYDPATGRWHVAVETSNAIEKDKKAFFEYHVVMVS